MPPMKWTVGFLVIGGVVLGGLFSSKLVNDDFPTDTRPEKRKFATRAANPPAQNPVISRENRDQIAPSRHCVTLDGWQAV
jgi:hypothetical protein